MLVKKEAARLASPKPVSKLLCAKLEPCNLRTKGHARPSMKKSAKTEDVFMRLYTANTGHGRSSSRNSKSHRSTPTPQVTRASSVPAMSFHNVQRVPDCFPRAQGRKGKAVAKTGARCQRKPQPLREVSQPSVLNACISKRFEEAHAMRNRLNSESELVQFAKRDNCHRNMMEPASANHVQQRGSFASDGNAPERLVESTIPQIVPENVNRSDVHQNEIVDAGKSLLKQMRYIDDPESRSEATAEWAKVRCQTRARNEDKVVEECSSWSLNRGEAFDYKEISTRFYRCAGVDVDKILQHLSCHLRTINRSSDCSRGLSICELGCGLGNFLQRLWEADKGNEDTEIDWDSSVGITGAHAEDLQTELFHRGIIERFNIDAWWQKSCDSGTKSAGPFNIIIGRYVFCHLRDPLGCLCCAYGKLADEGILCIIEPFTASINGHPLVNDMRYRLHSKLPSKAVLTLRSLLRHWSQVGVPVYYDFDHTSSETVLLLRRPAGWRGLLPLPSDLVPGPSLSSPPNANTDRKSLLHLYRACDRSSFNSEGSTLDAWLEHKTRAMPPLRPRSAPAWRATDFSISDFTRRGRPNDACEQDAFFGPYAS